MILCLGLFATSVPEFEFWAVVGSFVDTASDSDGVWCFFVDGDDDFGSGCVSDFTVEGEFGDFGVVEGRDGFVFF